MEESRGEDMADLRRKIDKVEGEIEQVKAALEGHALPWFSSARAEAFRRAGPMYASLTRADLLGELGRLRDDLGRLRDTEIILLRKLAGNACGSGVLASLFKTESNIRFYWCSSKRFVPFMLLVSTNTYFDVQVCSCASQTQIVTEEGICTLFISHAAY